MAGIGDFLEFALYFIGLLLLSEISYRLYIGALCTAMIFILIAVSVTCVVTWKRKTEKMSVVLRRTSGRAKEQLQQVGPATEQARELRTMCSLPASERPALCTCGAPLGGCGCGCESTRPEPLHLDVNESYYACDVESKQAAQPQEQLGDQIPPTPLVPPPPPPYFSVAKSVHEYEYIQT